MQQQPRQRPGFDKCVETKLRMDIFIRPWLPGWSFLRRIYTSRGSERVKGPSVEGVLMVDAWNAFYSLNRAVMLRNLQVLCPSFAVPAINFYRSNAELFVGDETILSQEGTTQGDPLSMAIYALSTLPLVSKISQENLTQTWFANDACGGASIQALHKWWTELSPEGPKFGYHVLIIHQKLGCKRKKNTSRKRKPSSKAVGST